MRPGFPHWCEKTAAEGGELRYSWIVIFVLILILVDSLAKLRIEIFVLFYIVILFLIQILIFLLV